MIAIRVKCTTRPRIEPPLPSRSRAGTARSDEPQHRCRSRGRARPSGSPPTRMSSVPQISVATTIGFAIDTSVHGVLPRQRCSFLITSFSPDHMSSTEQTFTSTRCIGSATSRITSSVMSVGTFDAFLGQLTQIKPFARSRSGRSSSKLGFKLAALGDEDVRRVDRRFGRLRAAEAAALRPRSRRETLAGMPSHHTRMPSLSDSFFASGVPE